MTLKVCADRCETCLYRLNYDRRTRMAILGEVRASGGFVSCHKHDGTVVCRGFYDDPGRSAGCALIRLARAIGPEAIAIVGPDEYLPPDDDNEYDDEYEGARERAANDLREQTLLPLLLLAATRDDQEGRS